MFYQLGALHEVLEKLQMKRIPPWEKKFGQVPMVIGYACIYAHNSIAIVKIHQA